MSADRQGDMTEAKRIAELLCGRIERGKRKRQQRRYFKKGSVEEKAARRALAKELRAIKKPLEFGLRLAIADLINSTATPTGALSLRTVVRALNRTPRPKATSQNSFG